MPLIWCPKYKINVNPEAECMCSNCIFYKQKKDEDEYVYLVCDFDNFYPELKKGKEW